MKRGAANSGQEYPHVAEDAARLARLRKKIAHIKILHVRTSQYTMI